MEKRKPLNVENVHAESDILVMFQNGRWDLNGRKSGYMFRIALVFHFAFESSDIGTVDVESPFGVVNGNGAVRDQILF